MNMTEEQKRIESRRIYIFLIVTFLITWVVEGLLAPLAMNSGDAEIMSQASSMISSMMFAPAFGALVARLLTKEGLSHSGLQFNFSQHKFCFLFGWFGVSVLIFLGAVLYFIFNPSNFDGNVTNYVELSIAAGSEMDAAQIMGAYKANLLTLIFSAPVMDILNAFGVEWGFRAYLLPKLYKKFGTLPSFFMTSLGYGIWYAPLISLGYFYGKDYAGFPGAGIVAMCVFCLAFGCILSYLSLKTGSIFPAVFAHSTMNVLMSDPANFTFDGGNVFVGPAPTGFLSMIPMIIVAVIMTVDMVKKPVIPSKEEPVEEKKSAPVPSTVEEDELEQLIEAELQDEMGNKDTE